MREPFRLRVMKALCDQLKTITVENGYFFDLQDYDDENGRPMERVFRGRDIFGVTDPLPLLCVLEDPRVEEPDNGSDGRGNIGKFRVLIQGFLNEDETAHPLDRAYQLSGDITTALVKGKTCEPGSFSRPSMGILGLGRGPNSVSAMKIGQAVHRPGRDGVSEYAYLLISVTFTLIENLETPYA